MITILQIKIQKDQYYSGLDKQHHIVDDGSSVGKGTVEYLGNIKDFPELFL